jgi:heat shock protein HtpX
MGALLILIGYFLGLYFFDSAFAGLVIAILVWAILSLVGYFQGDSILLGMSGRRKSGLMTTPACTMWLRK